MMHQMRLNAKYLPACLRFCYLRLPFLFIRVLTYFNKLASTQLMQLTVWRTIQARFPLFAFHLRKCKIEGFNVGLWDL